MAFRRDQRVALDGPDGTVGKVIDPDEQDGRVFVRLYNGCSGNFEAHRLHPVDDKQWPPVLETKAAG